MLSCLLAVRQLGSSKEFQNCKLLCFVAYFSTDDILEILAEQLVWTRSMIHLFIGCPTHDFQVIFRQFYNFIEQFSLGCGHLVFSLPTLLRTILQSLNVRQLRSQHLFMHLFGLYLPQWSTHFIGLSSHLIPPPAFSLHNIPIIVSTQLHNFLHR